MNKPTFAEVLTALCMRDPGIPKKPNGDIHTTAAAEALGLNQATLSRMLAGKSATPSPENALRIYMRFGVSGDQLSGYQEIPGLFEEGRYQYPLPTVVNPPPEAWQDFERIIERQVKDETLAEYGSSLSSAMIEELFLKSLSVMSDDQLTGLIQAVGRSVSPNGALKLAKILLDSAGENLPQDAEGQVYLRAEPPG